MISKPIPWDQFEDLIQKVRQAAQQPGNESLYRFLAFCALTAYGGMRTQEVLQLRWERLWVLNGKEDNRMQILFDRGKWVFHLEVNGYLRELLKESRRLARIVVDNNVSSDSKYSQLYVMGNLQSGGKKAMTIQSLNLLLKEVSLQYGGPGIDINTITLRKTYARHEYDIHGQTVEMLSILKQELGHSSTAVTMNFISQPNSC